MKKWKQKKDTEVKMKIQTDLGLRQREIQKLNKNSML